MAQGQLETEEPTRRELFHEILLSFATYVYFQPPTNVNMQYPCIRYEQDDAETLFAGNRPYLYTKRYQVTVIDPDPDTLIQDSIAALPLCKFDRHYEADDLHHYVFNIFF